MSKTKYITLAICVVCIIYLIWAFVEKRLSQKKKEKHEKASTIATVLSILASLAVGFGAIPQEPYFSPPKTISASPVTVHIVSPDNTKILYAGNEYEDPYIVYKNPIIVNRSATIRAQAIDYFGCKSKLVTEEYIIITPSPTPSPTPTPFVPPPQRNGYAFAPDDGVAMRGAADPSSILVSMLTKDVVVHVTGQEYMHGLTWHIVQHDTKWGYVRADQLRWLTDEETNIYLNSPGKFPNSPVLSEQKTTPTSTPTPRQTTLPPPPPTTPPPPKPSPVTPVPIPPPTSPYFDPPRAGDKFRVVNCDSFVTLRSTADAYDTDGYKKIDKNNTVSYQHSDGYGFYYVDSSKGKGYIYAGYLAPVDPDAIKVPGRISSYGGYFGSSDTIISGIRFNISTKQDVINQFGTPLRDDTTKVIIKYDKYWFHLNRADGEVVRIEFFGLGTAGPRGISIGMHISDVLSAFSQKNYSVLDHGGTNDYIWYTNEREKLASPYGYIKNEGSAGNGVIKFVENKYHMDVTIENSYVVKMSVYVEQ